MKESAFPLFRQARTDDPSTSKLNISKERNAEAKAWVLKAMADGVERTDDEIAYRCSELGCSLTADRLRHGRLACAEDKSIVQTGKRKEMSGGGMGRVWVKGVDL